MKVRTKTRAGLTIVPVVEVCMGMGIPISIGFPWDSHGIPMRMGVVFGLLMGMGIAYVIGEK